MKGIFRGFAGSVKVVARCTPDDKFFLVKLLQFMSAQVAVVGDSQADALSLKEATVGISMRSGCDVAKDASDLVLLKNDFAQIRTSIMWGRLLNKNMQKFLAFQLTVNIAICFITILGSVYGHPPLNVIQMLWVNLIMDILAAIALGTDAWKDKLDDTSMNSSGSQIEVN